jgi:hypothetical protein
MAAQAAFEAALRRPYHLQPTALATVLRLGVGIRFKPTFWFGYFGGKKIGFGK